MSLTDIQGVGPKKVNALTGAGYGTLEALAAFDARKDAVPEGLTGDFMRRARDDARRVLRAQGKSFEKAPYAKNAAKTNAAKPKAPRASSATAKQETEPVVSISQKTPPPTPTTAEPATRSGWFRRVVLRKN